MAKLNVTTKVLAELMVTLIFFVTAFGWHNFKCVQLEVQDVCSQDKNPLQLAGVRICTLKAKQTVCYTATTSNSL